MICLTSESNAHKEEIIMAKLTFKTDLCKGCGLCVDACPKGCLTIDNDQINKKG